MGVTIPIANLEEAFRLLNCFFVGKAKMSFFPLIPQLGWVLAGWLAQLLDSVPRSRTLCALVLAAG